MYMEMLDEIKNKLILGNWTDAQELFKSINPTPNDFYYWLFNQSLETALDFALLGFYCREYTGGNQWVA